jgi:hypothetical protein
MGLSNNVSFYLFICYFCQVGSDIVASWHNSNGDNLSFNLSSCNHSCQYLFQQPSPWPYIRITTITMPVMPHLANWEDLMEPNYLCVTTISLVLVCCHHYLSVSPAQLPLNLSAIIFQLTYVPQSYWKEGQEGAESCHLWPRRWYIWSTLQPIQYTYHICIYIVLYLLLNTWILINMVLYCLGNAIPIHRIG